MKKVPIPSDGHEMISQIKEDLKNDLWGMKKNNLQNILYIYMYTLKPWHSEQVGQTLFVHYI